MSSRKAKYGKRRTRKARHAGHSLSNEDIENFRLSALGVVATCELVRSSFSASRCIGIVLTRGALHRRRKLALAADQATLTRGLSFASIRGWANPVVLGGRHSYATGITPRRRQQQSGWAQLRIDWNSQ